MAGLSPLQLVAASLVIAAGSTIQGAFGFGMGLVAAPLLALIDPRLVPGPILLSGLLVALLVTIRERQAIDLFGLKWALLGRVAGTVVAAVLVSTLPPKETSILLGAIVLLAVGLSAMGLRVAPTKRALLGAGTLSGFMGTLSSIGAPPMAMLYQRASSDRLRATMSGYLAVGVTISIGALASAGGFGGREMIFSVLLVPGVLAGLLLSDRAKPLLERGHTRTAVLVLSALSSVVVILRQLL